MPRSLARRCRSFPGCDYRLGSLVEDVVRPRYCERCSLGNRDGEFSPASQLGGELPKP